MLKTYVAISKSGSPISGMIDSKNPMTEFDALVQAWKENRGLIAAYVTTGHNPVNVLRRVKASATKSPKKAKAKFVWPNLVAKFSVAKASEGGESFRDLKERLEDQGIPVRRGYSPYVGHYGVEVPEQYAQAAEDLIWPEVK